MKAEKKQEPQNDKIDEQSCIVCHKHLKAPYGRFRTNTGHVWVCCKTCNNTYAESR